MTFFSFPSWRHRSESGKTKKDEEISQMGGDWENETNKWELGSWITSWDGKKDVGGEKTGKFESAMQSTVLHQCLSPAFDNLIMVTYIVDRETE